MAENHIVLRIPHSLGASEAKRRIAAGIEAAKAQYGRFLASAETEWEASRMKFSLSALAQRIQGSIDVEEEFVELRAELPMAIRMLAGRFLPGVQDIGRKLLK